MTFIKSQNIFRCLHLYPVQLSDYPSLYLKVETKPLENILGDFDIVCSANLTSASVDAYLSGLKIIVMLCPTDLNFSPLSGCPSVSFVGTPVEISEAFQTVPSKKTNKPDRSEFFFLDPKFPRWRRLLSSVSSTCNEHVKW